jgi:hypothetical protein
MTDYLFETPIARAARAQREAEARAAQLEATLRMIGTVPGGDEVTAILVEAGLVPGPRIPEREHAPAMPPTPGEPRVPERAP